MANDSPSLSATDSIYTIYVREREDRNRWARESVLLSGDGLLLLIPTPVRHRGIILATSAMHGESKIPPHHVEWSSDYCHFHYYCYAALGGCVSLECGAGGGL